MAKSDATTGAEKGAAKKPKKVQRKAEAVYEYLMAENGDPVANGSYEWTVALVFDGWSVTESIANCGLVTDRAFESLRNGCWDEPQDGSTFAAPPPGDPPHF